MYASLQIQTAVTAYLKSKQLLLFAFALQLGPWWSRHQRLDVGLALARATFDPVCLFKAPDINFPASISLSMSTPYKVIA